MRDKRNLRAFSSTKGPEISTQSARNSRLGQYPTAIVFVTGPRAQRTGVPVPSRTVGLCQNKLSRGKKLSLRKKSAATRSTADC